jgi:hypothetical protein
VRSNGGREQHTLTCGTEDKCTGEASTWATGDWATGCAHCDQRTVYRLRFKANGSILGVSRRGCWQQAPLSGMSRRENQRRKVLSTSPSTIIQRLSLVQEAISFTPTFPDLQTVGGASRSVDRLASHLDEPASPQALDPANPSGMLLACRCPPN